MIDLLVAGWEKQQRDGAISCNPGTVCLFYHTQMSRRVFVIRHALRHTGTKMGSSSQEKRHAITW